MAAGATGLSTATAAAGAGDAGVGAGDAGVGAGAASDHFWKTVAYGRFLYQRFLKIEFWLYISVSQPLTQRHGWIGKFHVLCISQPSHSLT